MRKQLSFSRLSFSRFSRRSFLAGAGAAGLGTLAPRAGWAAPAARGISIGYAAITWGDQGSKVAIDEISAAGYPGIQLRLSILKDFESPAALKEALARAGLTFACLSGGGPGADPAKRQAEVDKFLEGARFAKAAGALTIQATSPRRGDKVEPAQLKAFGEILGEIGKKTSAMGLPLAFHPHMDQIGESADEVDQILAASDPRYVKLLLDTGHWAAAGGDPVTAVKKHGKRLAMLHIKDVKDRTPTADNAKKFEFVELGQGKVDFPAVFAALKAARYAGWAVVELDRVPAGRAPKDAALANKAFLEKTLGLQIGKKIG
jgi:inosose dehydratase